MTQEKISVNTIQVKSEYYYNELLLLSCEISYPQFTSQDSAIRLEKINRLLRQNALVYQEYCSDVLMNMAIEQYWEGVEGNYPLRGFEAILTHEITYLSDCIVSFYSDRYEYTGGAHGNTTRVSATYNAKTGRMLDLNSIIVCRDSKKYLFNEIKEQIDKEPSVYFENAGTLIAETFSPNQFYVTPQGMVIYYQHYDIAPYSSGIREFLIPYSDCVRDPETFCSK